VSFIFWYFVVSFGLLSIFWYFVFVIFIVRPSYYFLGIALFETKQYWQHDMEN